MCRTNWKTSPDDEKFVGLCRRRGVVGAWVFDPGEGGRAYLSRSDRRELQDLTEVLALANEGLIMHNVIPVNFDDIDESLEALGRDDVVGRAVIIYD